MATPNIGEVATASIEARNKGKKLADNVSKNNAIISTMDMKRRRRPVRGGRVILEEIDFRENQTADWYAGYEPMGTAPGAIMDAAEYQYRQASVAVTISGLEKIQNSGEAEMIDLITARINNAEASLRNLIAKGMYSNGSAKGGREIDGLLTIVSPTPTTGTVGGINREDWTFWQNEAATADLDNATLSTRADITLAALNDMWVKLVRGQDHPDLVLMSNAPYTSFLYGLQAQQRVVNPGKLAKRGFRAVEYMGADVVLDGGQGGYLTGHNILVLNTDFLHYRPTAVCDFDPLGDTRESENQDATVRFLGWCGNMTTSNPSLQGRISNA